MSTHTKDASPLSTTSRSSPPLKVESLESASFHRVLWGSQVQEGRGQSQELHWLAGLVLGEIAQKHGKAQTRWAEEVFALAKAVFCNAVGSWPGFQSLTATTCVSPVLACKSSSGSATRSSRLQVQVLSGTILTWFWITFCWVSEKIDTAHHRQRIINEVLTHECLGCLEDLYTSEIL